MKHSKPRLYLVTDSELQRSFRCRAEGCGALIVFHDTGRSRIPLDVPSKQPALEPGTWHLEPHWGKCLGADGFRRTRPIR